MNGLTYIRKRCNISLNELAEVMGISRQAISSWENGRKKIPVERKKQLAKFFGIDEKYFNEISEEDKIELLKKGMYRWNGLDKETYLYRDSSVGIPESNKSALWFLKNSSTSLDEEFTIAKSKKSVLLDKISISFDWPSKREKMILDYIGAVGRGCAVYGGIYELFEEMKSQKILLKVPYFQIILSVIQATSYSLLGRSNSYISENYLDEEANRFIEQLTEIIREYWQMKTKEMNEVERKYKKRRSDKKMNNRAEPSLEMTVEAAEKNYTQLLETNSETELYTRGYLITKDKDL